MTNTTFIRIMFHFRNKISTIPDIAKQFFCNLRISFQNKKKLKRERAFSKEDWLYEPVRFWSATSAVHGSNTYV